MKGGISEEGEFGTQTIGNQFEIENSGAWERTDPPRGEFQMTTKKDSMGRKSWNLGRCPGVCPAGAIRKE